MQTLELLFFTLDLNTLKISSLVPHLRKISTTAAPHVTEKGWYLFQNLYISEGTLITGGVGTGGKESVPLSLPDRMKTTVADIPCELASSFNFHPSYIR